MLQELHVTNFALIDSLHLSFGAGLNILTGETGAGKSIIIDALGLALGERASGGDVVRTGTERATVEAAFDLSGAPPEVRARLAEAGLDGEEDDVLLVARELSRGGGKSQCRINGRLMPVSALKAIADGLVDVHGQHEHQSLLHADRHVDILDDWCGREALDLRAEVAAQLSALNGLRREREQLQTDARERARTLDLYRFQQEEIAGAHLRPAEEEELLADRSRLANAEKLSAAAQEGYAALSGGDRGGGGALDALNAALAAVAHAAALDGSLSGVIEALQGAVSYAEDASHELRDYQEGVEFNPERLEEIESRLDLLRTLKRKYGETVDEIIAYGDELAGKLDRLEHAEAREDELTAAIEKAQAALDRTAAKLTLVRKGVSADFAQRIMRELADLGMAATKFEVSIEPQAPTSRGANRVEFLLSPNPGEPLRPLARIASGGEMSRIMLAMKSVLVRAGGTPTMIFDEVDVGVGGRTAQVIADKLDALAGQAQILCITHLPQIASRADTHFYIEKCVDGGRTTVSVATLDAEGRVEEIARMLGGTRRTEAVVQHAREMLSVG
ncbi:MAG: DNA repair protein RecN [Armatimonadetes bacterium]|nr:DNA repair protein RecN [Armatimonadota bacterium]